MKDVITALRTMGETISYFGKIVLTLALHFLIGLTVAAVLVFLIAKFFWYVMGAIALGMIIGWFYMEYNTAKAIREYEELNENISRERQS